MIAASPLPMTPFGWGETLAAPPALERRLGGAVPALVRRWRDIPPDIDQHALDQHYLSVHLGGPKRLRRVGEGQSLVREVKAGAYSIVPAGAAYQWRTEGPIDFLHVYLDPATIDRCVAMDFDRDPRAVELRDSLGDDDRLLASVIGALAEALDDPDGWQQAYIDHLMQLLIHQLLRRHSDAGLAATPRVSHALAPYKLRRAIDFIETELARPIGVADIAAVTGTSPFHFSRAFRHATGHPPYAYLLERRLLRARELLSRPELALGEIARQCGFGGLTQFARAFRRSAGVSASEWRNRR